MTVRSVAQLIRAHPQINLAEPVVASYVEYYEVHAQREQVLVAEAVGEIDPERQDMLVDAAQMHHRAALLLISAIDSESRAIR